jgi:hypothetical protein
MYRMTVDEYLHTSFEDGDCDYVDGFALERNIGENWHSWQMGQIAFMAYFDLKFHTLMSIRLRIREDRYRVADVAVWPSGTRLGPNVPTVQPFLAVEVFGSEDRLPAMVARAQDYLSGSIPCVWLVDPWSQQAWLCDEQHPAGTQVKDLPVGSTGISIPLSAIFAGIENA